MKTLVKFNDEYSSRDREYMKNAIRFYKDSVGLDRFSGKLYIQFLSEVPHKTNYSDTTDTTNVGLCQKFNDDIYRVFVSSATTDDVQVKTVFHELCHVLQWVTGKQRIDNLGRTVWNNSVPYPSTNADTYNEYLNFPWEREARDHEETYYELWCKQPNKTGSIMQTAINYAKSFL